MSSERIEAAAKALATAEGFDDVEQYERDHAVLILTAADAVMFSDEAIERAAQALGNQYEPWAESHPHWHEVCRQDIRTVVAALKGEQP